MLSHDSFSETQKDLKACSLVQRAYFSSSAIVTTEAVGDGICRTLVLVAPIDLCSLFMKTVLSSGG